MSNKFDSLKLNEELIKNLIELQYIEMTPIQKMSLPITLKGKDIIAQAKTGSGKTAAFGLSILNDLDVKNTRIQSLVLCPTRELAEQVAKELRRLARMMKNVKILTITGGTGEYHQDRSLEHGAHIVVGTPGRIRKLITKKTMFVNTVTKFVLDEADRMLDMGFVDDIEWIHEHLIQKNQTLLFSATFPDKIIDLSSDIQSNAEVVKVDTGHSEDVIDQIFVELDSHKEKMDALLKILDKYRPSRFLVFCKTKAITDRVAEKLFAADISALSIHGDLDQNERTRTLTLFSNNSLNALVATDVAARGIDIKDLEMVVNFDLANDPEIYTHRIGRTARAGKSGKAVSLFMGKEIEKYYEICEYQNTTTDLKKIKLDELESDSDYDIIPPMKTLFISGGKKDKLRPGDVVGAIVKNSDATFDDVGDITILNINTFVAIKSELMDSVLESLKNIKIKNKSFRIGLVKP
jgi:ATP-independent RNA helicase DbpA